MYASDSLLLMVPCGLHSVQLCMLVVPCGTHSVQLCMLMVPRGTHSVHRRTKDVLVYTNMCGYTFS